MPVVKISLQLEAVATTVVSRMMYLFVYDDDIVVSGTEKD